MPLLRLCITAAFCSRSLLQLSGYLSSSQLEGMGELQCLAVGAMTMVCCPTSPPVAADATAALHSWPIAHAYF